MNFDWTAEQLEIYRNTVEFARTHLLRDMPENDRNAEFYARGWQRCGEQGLLSSVIPEDYGGLGLDALSSAIMMQALGYGCPDMGLVFSIGAHIYACSVPLVRFGSESLKRKYLPELASGRMIATHSVTEPGAGSDAFALTTRARREGDYYVLDGAKSFATNAPVASLYLVHATTNPKAGFMGITAFLVPRDAKGLTVSKPYQKLGLRTSPLGDLYLDQVRIPADHILGAEGNGGSVFTHSMNWERTCLFAAYVGAMERQLEQTIEYARTRRQSRRRISEFQAVSHRIVDMKVRLEAARMLIYKGAWLLDHGRPSLISADSAIAKVFLSEAAVTSALDAIQVHGGMGIMSECDTERYLRDAVPSRIFSGTSEIQRNTIAKALRLD